MESCFIRVIDRFHDEITEKYGGWMPPFLKWLAMIAIHCCPAKHCELRTPRYLWCRHIKPEKSILNKPDGIGVPIGRMSSQTGMGLYINDEVAWLNDDCGIRTTVFMDDGVMVVPDRLKSYALSLLPELRRRLAAKGVKMNDKKFYCQQYWKGLEFLGSHIHPWSVILNDATWVRCMARIEEYNQLTTVEKYRELDRFISTVNSYTGLLENRTSYKRIMILKETIGDDWWQWLEWDQRRLCVVSKPQTTFRQRLKRKYHLKLKNMKQDEIQQLINEQSTIILDRESRLTSTDYIAAKIAEGKATQEEYADKIAERQQWRDDINAAQDEIERLKDLEPDHEDDPTPEEHQ